MTSGTNFKTLVVKAGETAVVKKNIKIIKVINNGNVEVTSPCTELEDKLTGSSESLFEYYIALETMDELLHGGGTNDWLTGFGLGGNFYAFPTMLSMTDFQDPGVSPTGVEKLYDLLTTIIPGGAAFFSSPTYEYNNWSNSGQTSRDNVYRQILKFKSFSSIVEDMELYVNYLNTPTAGNNITNKYNMRIYATRVSS
jgi:hypothetical protein